MIIDCHAHATPMEYAELLERETGLKSRSQGFWNESERLREMDKRGIDIQLLHFTPGPPFYQNPELSIRLARATNDALANICRKRPERFRAFAVVPLDRPQWAVPELERAVELGLRGVTIGSNVLGKTPDDPAFEEVLAKIDQLALPIFIHPTERDDFPPAWRHFRLDHYIGWPADTAVSVAKMICSGMFDRFKNIKLLLSHLGGPIPSMLGRIDRSFRDGKCDKRPSAYFKTFYFDTAGPATAPGVECAAKLFGADQLVFGTDLPWGQEGDYVERALESVEKADLAPEKKELIYHTNARRLLGL